MLVMLGMLAGLHDAGDVDGHFTGPDEKRKKKNITKNKSEKSSNINPHRSFFDYPAGDNFHFWISTGPPPPGSTKGALRTTVQLSLRLI